MTRSLARTILAVLLPMFFLAACGDHTKFVDRPLKGGYVLHLTYQSIHLWDTYIISSEGDVVVPFGGREQHRMLTIGREGDYYLGELLAAPAEDKGKFYRLNWQTGRFAYYPTRQALGASLNLDDAEVVGLLQSVESFKDDS